MSTIPTLLIAQAASSQAPQPSTIISTIWLGLVILGVIGILVVGFVAKRIENIHNPTYAKAFLAQFLIGWLSLAGFFLFGLYFQAPVYIALGVAICIIPVAIYKIVFGSMWREAALIWLAVTVAQTGATYGMIVAGLVSLAAITSGA